MKTDERGGAAGFSADALKIIEHTHLERGYHRHPGEGMCALELVAFVAGERHTDHPECVCPVLGAFVRSWNDELPDDERDAILKPILPRLIGTRGSEALAGRRSLMAADWLVRVHTPAWLRLAKLDAQADALAALPEIMSMAQVPSIRGPIEAARHDAFAAGAAAGAGSPAAAGAAAWATAGAAAGAATRAASWAAAAGAAAWTASWAAALSAAGAAAGAAARAAAGAAAGAAARAALNDTRLALQRSAADLVIRMIEMREAVQ